MSKVPYLKGLNMTKVCGTSNIEVNKIGAWERKGWSPCLR